jgi:ketosteroid isomerase-like protein
MDAARNPQEVFPHHAQALGAEDLDGIVADYADNAVVITPNRLLRGKDGIRENFVQLLGEVPQAAWDIKNTVYEGDAMLPRVAATASRMGSIRSSSATA